MNIADVKKLSPLERLTYWIKERESIRLKKEAGEPKPWTDDTILQSYRFCNVRRMDDKVSRWLMTNWYEPYKDHKNVLLACVLARQLNNPDSLGEIGFPERWDPKKVATVLEKRVERGLRNFSAAYMITGTLGGTKVEQIVYKVADPIYKRPPVVDRSSLRTTAENLLPYKGFSTFIAGQVVADLRWTMTGTWEDKNRWAPKGPGSVRGLNRLNGQPHDRPMKTKEFEEGLTNVIFTLKKLIPSTITRRIEAHDYQSCLCEFDKYERTLFEGRRPKQKYPGER